MTFNSLEFIFFLPIVFSIYWFLKKSLRTQNLFVILASYVFYGYWNWKLLILIFVTTLCSYLGGVWMNGSSNMRKKIILWGNIVVNIGILGVFKYYDFFAENISKIFRGIGFELDWVSLHLVLPIGISFYTFQALSYTIDVYRCNIKPTKDAIAFFAFISFFPQLVAGPIERASNLLPQFLSTRSFRYDNAVTGCRQMLWGLFKKMVVADNCAVAVKTVFDNYTQYASSTLWIGAILFAFQIYCDFSGYSDMAVGLAKLFGINLTKNFNLPYFSRDITEYWRKWHISLMTWLRDYIYIPLGGGRVGKAQKIRNTFIVFLISGLWHGADWTFVAWGGYNAVLFVPAILFREQKGNVDPVSKDRILPSFRDSLLMCFTFILVVIGFIIFRSDNIGNACNYIIRLFTSSFLPFEPIGMKALIWCEVLVVLEWIQRNRNCVLDFKEHGLLKFKAVRLCLYAVIFAGCIFFSGGEIPYIYSQF